VSRYGARWFDLEGPLVAVDGDLSVRPSAPGVVDQHVDRPHLAEVRREPPDVVQPLEVGLRALASDFVSDPCRTYGIAADWDHPRAERVKLASGCLPRSRRLPR